MELRNEPKNHLDFRDRKWSRRRKVNRMPIVEILLRNEKSTFRSASFWMIGLSAFKRLNTVIISQLTVSKSAVT